MKNKLISLASILALGVGLAGCNSSSISEDESCSYTYVAPQEQTCQEITVPLFMFSDTDMSEDNGVYTLAFEISTPYDVKALNKSVNSYEIVYSNCIAYFTAKDDTNGYELWSSDGTVDGTKMVKNINPNGDSNPSYLIDVNGTLYFQADDGENGKELWKSDGTEVGTVMVKDINTAGDSNPEFPSFANGILYFQADDGENGKELWKSDGTVDGTIMVKDINTAGDSDPYPDNMININGTVYFTATNETNGDELWKTNGEEACTVMVKDINPLSEDSNPGDFTNFKDTLYFTAKDGTNGNELWKSDGTEAGTVMVKDINLDGDSNPFDLTISNETLYFVADSGNIGEQLWKIDTNGEAVMFKMIGTNGSDANNLIDFDGTLYFTADDGTRGEELWKSDGTFDGTDIVADLNTNVNYNHSSPDDFNIVDGTLYFTAYDDDNDSGFSTNLWKLDDTGTPVKLPMEANLSGDVIDINNINDIFSYGGKIYTIVWNTLNECEEQESILETDGTNNTTTIFKKGYIYDDCE